MARVQLGGIVTNIRGSINGSTYQRFRGGIVVKSKPKQTISNSIYRNGNLSIMGKVAALWRSLDAADRDAWNDFALSRNLVKSQSFPTAYTGQMLFQQINYYLLPLVGEAIVAPAVPLILPSLNGVTSVENNGSLLLNLDDSIDSDVDLLLVKISGPVSPSIANPGSRLKYIGPDPPYSDPIDITNIYEERFGSIPDIGQTVWLSSAMMSLTSYYIRSWKLSQFTVI